MAATARYAEIKIDYDRGTGKIVVVPENAPLYWEVGPADARWRRKDGTGVTWEFDIEFKDGRSPLRVIDHSTGPAGYEVTGTDNTREAGLFPYTVVIREGTKVLGRLDPSLDNNPSP